MSYDAYMTVDTGKGFVKVGEQYHMTSNVAPMWDKAMDDTGAGFNLRDLAYHKKQMTGEEIAPILRKAAIYMDSRPHDFLPMEPVNGHGTFQGASNFLWLLVNAAEDHPKAILFVSN